MAVLSLTDANNGNGLPIEGALLVNSFLAGGESREIPRACTEEIERIKREKQEETQEEKRGNRHSIFAKRNTNNQNETDRGPDTGNDLGDFVTLQHAQEAIKSI